MIKFLGKIELQTSEEAKRDLTTWPYENNLYMWKKITNVFKKVIKNC